MPPSIRSTQQAQLNSWVGNPFSSKLRGRLTKIGSAWSTILHDIFTPSFLDLPRFPCVCPKRFPFGIQFWYHQFWGIALAPIHQNRKLHQNDWAMLQLVSFLLSSIVFFTLKMPTAFRCCSFYPSTNDRRRNSWGQSFSTRIRLSIHGGWYTLAQWARDRVRGAPGIRRLNKNLSCKSSEKNNIKWLKCKPHALIHQGII